MKLYACLQTYGTELFGDHIRTTHELTQYLASKLKENPSFELATWPQANIICFRYIGSESSKTSAELDLLQQEIRNRIVRQENRFYIVSTEWKGKLWLRCTIMNPLTSNLDLDALCSLMQKCGGELEK